MTLTTQKTAPSVPPELLRAAFQLFLQRDPNPQARNQFADFGALIGALFGSKEFLASAQAQKTNLPWPERQYFIARDLGILYCPIGKNACSFFKRAMVTLAQHPARAVLDRSIHQLTDHICTGLQLSDYSETEIDAIWRDPDLYSFAILRDPLRRLLSAYIEKFVVNRLDAANLRYHTGPVIEAVQKAQGLETPDYHRGIRFRDFVNHILSQPPEQLDPHWRPQHLYLGAHRWSALYDFDHLDRAVQDLEQMSGIELKRPPVNRSGSGVGQAHFGADQLLPEVLDKLPMIEAESFFPDEIRAKIRQYYAQDVALMAQTR
ncbi:sulfotransferase family 2 domain-containing protein (plasmid) [Thioclava litoralis]|uniref:Sulfotransferase family 2 domain-containing protein n=1 Tax=Thioclava litoralis TaxID=3076557 RepID=A0ABZ1E5B9_9RHOB|nr:sulfotransferase family 2 domain-containing protein [Thioclava sp. FTW29]